MKKTQLTAKEQRALDALLGTGDLGYANLTQAERIIEKFGGAARLTKILSSVGHPLPRSTVYRWLYPRSQGGTGGIIPITRWGALFLAAHHDGVFLTIEDFDPRIKAVKP